MNPDAPLNALFVVTHDLSPRLGCYADPHAVTPHLDALANGPGGVRFDRHFCQWPLCGPSRANLFSGLRPQRTQRHDNRPFWGRLREGRPAGYATLGEAFKGAGHRSEHVWHVLHAYETDPPSWSSPAWFPPNPPAPAGTEAIGSEEMRYWQTEASFDLVRARLAECRERGVPEHLLHRHARGPAVEAAPVADEAYPDGRGTARAEALIAEHDAATPLFLAVGYEAGHLPWTAPQRDFDAHAGGDYADATPEPAGSPPFAEGDKEPAQYYWTHDYERPWDATPEQHREMLRGHHASVTFLDRQVGRLVETLKQKGLYDSTLIVFTSDHGFHVGEHGYYGKHTPWDASFHCPLIVRNPRGPEAAQVVDAVTEHVDVLPTVCGLAGVPLPAGLDGRNLAGPGGRIEAAPHHIATGYRRRLPGDGGCGYFDALTARSRDHRLTVYRGGSGEEIGRELFDYAADPGETRNHAGEPALAAVERALQARLAPDLADPALLP